MTAKDAVFRDGWDLYRIASLDDPHPVWADLREKNPVLDAGGGVYFVSSFALANEGLQHPAVRAGSGVAESLGATEGLLYDVTTSWLMSLDGTEHRHARELVRREFTPKRVEALRPFIDATARRLAAGFAASLHHGAADLVPDVAFAVPSEVIRHLFAIAEDDWEQHVVPLIHPGASRAEPAACIVALAEHFRERLENGDTKGGLLEQLCAADLEHGQLSELAVVANAVLLVTAAIDTTTGLIANTLACLISHPEQLERVRMQPELVAGAVEETLRFEPPALSCSRTTAGPIILGGVSIPAGSHLLFGIAAANRDPAQFPDADRFDIGRPVLRGAETLSFGGGRHYCLGAALARLETQLAVAAVLESCPDLELCDSIAWRKDNPTVRAPTRLRIAQRAPA